MSLLSTHGLVKYYGSTRVLNGITCVAEEHQKIGLIGRNGSGKTTLLRILIDAEEATEGAVVRGADLKIGYVPQYLEIDPSITVTDYLLGRYHELRSRLRGEEAALATAKENELTALLESYQRIRDACDAEGFDEMPARAQMLLHDFKLANHAGQTVATLSGGKRNLLGLSRTLSHEVDTGHHRPITTRGPRSAIGDFTCSKHRHRLSHRNAAAASFRDFRITTHPRHAARKHPTRTARRRRSPVCPTTTDTPR